VTAVRHATGRVLLAGILAVAILQPALSRAQPTTDYVLAAGDISPLLNAPRADDYATSEIILRELAATPDATVVPLGDTQYQSGDEPALRSQLGYTGSWGRFLERTCPVVGNHEYYTPDAAGFFAYFGDRTSACATSGHPELGWYAFTLPASGWRVYILNSDCGRNGNSPGCTPNSLQVAWLRDDLTSHPGACALAAMHHPRWGQRAPFPDDPVVATLWNTLEQGHADLVIAGHEHAYARLTAMTPTGQVAAAGRGIRQITVGTGGNSLIPFGGPARVGTRTRDNTHFGVIRLTLTPTAWTTTFLRTDGAAADQASAGCRI
jgi:hypothetical protein